VAWTRALGFLVSFALLPACGGSDDEDRDYQLIVDNNGNVSVDVWLWDDERMRILEDHHLEPFEVVSLWMSEETLKDYPRLRVYTHSEGDELIDLALHRSYFTGPGLSFRVTVYP